MINVTISDKTALTSDICRIRFVASNGSTLPLSTPGSHVDVELPNGLIRQYSLCSAPGATYYEIAVLNDPQSRGGSAYVHEQLKVGDSLNISEAKNLFPLAESASHNILVAAGVGITPILSMAEHLLAKGGSFTLYYCTKSPELTAYKERIETSGLVQHCHFYFSQQHAGKRIDLSEIIQAPSANTHLYVCGPVAFNDDVIAYAQNSGWHGSNIHREYFSAAPIDHSADESFEIEINSTGDVFNVSADMTILEVLEDNGIFIPVACEEGVCGTCITRLIAGEADHKDIFMTDEEHSKMDKITPCCSRAKSARLVLDIE